MSERKDEVASKKYKRKLTPFLCQEMLYEFATDQLDTERQLAVEEFLEKDRECQELLAGIRAALAYTQGLAQTELSPDVFEQLKTTESAVSLGRKYSNWREWPETLRWSLTAITLSAVVAIAVAVTPWQKVLLVLHGQKSSDAGKGVVEVAKIPEVTDEATKSQLESNEVDALAANESSGDDPPSPNDEGSGDSDESGVPPTSAGNSKTPSKTGSEIKIADAGLTSQVATKPLNQKPATAAKPTSESAEHETETESESGNSKAKGFVFRAFMTLHDLDVTGPKVTELIRELGGKKAGEVELGWKRGNSVRYYHFAIPEENQEKLMEQLQSYGPVRISKDPHSRVMPEGQVRFILWIESAN